jgi:putative flavoprotein involved in K+ transport
MSAVLQQRGREHVVLERRQVGGRWRTERWESLRFQFPNWSLELPGYAYSGDDPNGFASWHEILHVIEDYAASTRAPVREHIDVRAVRREDGGFALAVAGGTIHAQRVVVATGPFQKPRIPPFSRDVAPSVLQTDPTHYRHPDDLPDGAVLVVGSGASGCQIGEELLRAGRTVYLSVSRHRRVPRRFRGKDVYWWLERMGRFATTIDTFPGRQWPPSIVVTGVSGGYDVNVRQMVAGGVRVLGRVLDASDGTVAVAMNANEILDEAGAAFGAFMADAREFAAANPDLELADEEPTESAGFAAPLDEVNSFDLRRENVTAIIWATGYEYDYGWLSAPVFDVHGRPLQQRGVSPEPGLYFLGLHWMHTIKSGLFSGVGDDARHVADHMDRLPLADAPARPASAPARASPRTGRDT